ncbi:hypothetical protein Vadar_024108 [Vaccinium darrowii]|uniref:Uncharacterized protein n=1 Tax=Vaccinium darrowii TaxID=229202 RepID=A0ACB7X3R2_9ERIC|nr:hypothetical protein Vadar_024108 [Vaccinium darrowii]
MVGARRIPLQCLAVALTLHVAVIGGEFFKPFNVSYDHRALIIDGKRRMLISAGIHYPRATPQMWPDLIAKSKEGGADVIQTYAFWSGHEPVKGQYNFEGRYDIVKFAKLVGSAGLYLHLRIGPYVCAEWNFGGLPVWLRDVPGIEFRTENAPFKDEMQRFVTKIVDLMREEMLFSWQGGPIIMLQIENEYGNVESSYGQKGKEYVKWAAKMAIGLGAGVPWVMCKQVDAPDDIIDACNGYYCDGFRPNSYKKPTLWTENWDGWFAIWGGSLPHRPAEDLAFAVARFFQRGGSFQNYYMFFGGTNFGRTSGGPNYITSYDYDAPIDEYGLLRQPKWGHLKDLHAAIKLCEPALVAADSPQYITLGPKQEAHVYRENKSRCSAFLANIDERNSATVTFFGQVYTLPPWSVSILPDCRKTVFNTAKIGAQTSVKTTEYSLPSTNVSVLQQLPSQDKVSLLSETWTTVKEPIGAWGEDNFTVRGILQHLNVTKDHSDYLWYMTRIYVSEDDISYWEDNSVEPALTIDSMRDLVRIFINGQYAGSKIGSWVKVEQPIQLKRGYNDLVLLSVTVGLQNYGAFFEKDGAGFKGQIKVTGFINGDIDLSDSLWTYQPPPQPPPHPPPTTTTATTPPPPPHHHLQPPPTATHHHPSPPPPTTASTMHHRHPPPPTTHHRHHPPPPATTTPTPPTTTHHHCHHPPPPPPHHPQPPPPATTTHHRHHRHHPPPPPPTSTHRRHHPPPPPPPPPPPATMHHRRHPPPPPPTTSSLPLAHLQPTHNYVGLRGEFLQIYSIVENGTAGWTDLTQDAIPSPFSWYKAYFKAPDGTDPVALDLGSMGKGQAWVNGHHIGRYWTKVAPKDGCQRTCDYRGPYNSDKCTTNCGKPTQIWYHVPRSWLQASNNSLALFEETGGNPLEISIKSHSTKVVCAQVSESHYPPLQMWSHPDFLNGKISVNEMIAKMHLQCDDGHKISSIQFASYGTPRGSCQKFSKGNCHSPNSLSVVSEACVGRNSCSVGISNTVFGDDPCHGTVKTLAVEARCVPSQSIGFSAMK